MKKLILLASCLTPMLMTNLEAKFAAPEAIAAPVPAKVDAYLRSKFGVKPMSPEEIEKGLADAKEKVEIARNAIDPGDIANSAKKYCDEKKDSVFGDVIELCRILRDIALHYGDLNLIGKLNQISIEASKGYRLEEEVLNEKSENPEYKSKETRLSRILESCLNRVEKVIDMLQSPVSEEVKPEEKPAIEAFPAVADEFKAEKKPVEPGIEPRDSFADDFRTPEAEEKPFEPEVKKEFEPFAEEPRAPFSEDVEPEEKPAEPPAIVEEPTRNLFDRGFDRYMKRDEKMKFDPFAPRLEEKNPEETSADPVIEEPVSDSFADDFRVPEKPTETPAIIEEPDRDLFAESFAASEKPAEPGIEPRDSFAAEFKAEEKGFDRDMKRDEDKEVDPFAAPEKPAIEEFPAVDEEFKATETPEKKTFEPEMKKEDESRDNTGLPHFRADTEPQKEEKERKSFWEF